MKSLIIAVLAVAGIGALAFAQENPVADTEPMVTPAATQPDRFAVWSAGHETECTISLGGDGVPGSVDVASGCGEVFAGLDRVADARFGSDGELQLCDAGGRVIVEFAPSEGFFMESVHPANALLALSEASR